jgi:hypothetical protein
MYHVLDRAEMNASFVKCHIQYHGNVAVTVNRHFVFRLSLVERKRSD